MEWERVGLMTKAAGPVLTGGAAFFGFFILQLGYTDPTEVNDFHDREKCNIVTNDIILL